MLKMKKLLTGILLFCFWQNVKCGIITLTNNMDYDLKFVVMPAYDDVNEIKSMALKPKESGVIIVDVSKGERLWVAYYGTLCKLPNKMHYRTILLPDNKNYHVKVKNIAYPFLGGSAIYDSELIDSKFVQSGVVMDGEVESIEIVPSISTIEPKLFYHGEKVLTVYHAQYSTPFDVSKKLPVCLATFNRIGKFFESESGQNRYKYSRIAINTYSGVNTDEPDTISPICIMEFDPNSVDNLPTGIRDAIITKYHGIDLSKGLYTGLTKLGVNIFVTSCAFGPIPVAISGSGSIPHFNLNLSGFRSLGHGENDSIYIGLFQTNGINSWLTNPMAKDKLEEQSFSKNFSKDMFGCQLINQRFASFYTVAITKDCKNILITLVLIVNFKSDIKALTQIFVSERTFKALLDSLMLYAKTYDSNDKQALAYMINSLTVLSGNRTIIPQHDSQSISISSTSGGYTSSSSSTVGTHSQPTSSTTSDTQLASYAKTLDRYCDGKAVEYEYMINSLEASSASTISHSASISSTSGGYASSSYLAVGNHPTSSTTSDANKL